MAVKIYENKTKVPQVYYDHNLNRIELKPGQRYEENISEILDAEKMRKDQVERSVLEADVEEMKRVKKALALVRVSKSIEELDKFKEGEKNEDVITAILLKQSDLLKKEATDDTGGVKGKI